MSDHTNHCKQCEALARRVEELEGEIEKLQSGATGTALRKELAQYVEAISELDDIVQMTEGGFEFIDGLRQGIWEGSQVQLCALLREFNS